MRSYRGHEADQALIKAVREIGELEKQLKEQTEKYETILDAYNRKCAQFNHLINEAGKL